MAMLARSLIVVLLLKVVSGYVEEGSMNLTGLKKTKIQENMTSNNSKASLNINTEEVNNATKFNLLDLVSNITVRMLPSPCNAILPTCTVNPFEVQFKTLIRMLSVEKCNSCFRTWTENSTRFFYLDLDTAWHCDYSMPEPGHAVVAIMCAPYQCDRFRSIHFTILTERKCRVGYNFYSLRRQLTKF